MAKVSCEQLAWILGWATDGGVGLPHWGTDWEGAASQLFIGDSGESPYMESVEKKTDLKLKIKINPTGSAAWKLCPPSDRVV